MPYLPNIDPFNARGAMLEAASGGSPRDALGRRVGHNPIPPVPVRQQPGGFGAQQPGGFGAQQQGGFGAQQPGGYNPASGYGQQPQQSAYGTQGNTPIVSAEAFQNPHHRNAATAPGYTPNRLPATAPGHTPDPSPATPVAYTVGAPVVAHAEAYYEPQDPPPPSYGEATAAPAAGIAGTGGGGYLIGGAFVNTRGGRRYDTAAGAAAGATANAYHNARSTYGKKQKPPSDSSSSSSSSDSDNDFSRGGRKQTKAEKKAAKARRKAIKAQREGAPASGYSAAAGIAGVGGGYGAGGGGYGAGTVGQTSHGFAANDASGAYNNHGSFQPTPQTRRQHSNLLITEHSLWQKYNSVERGTTRKSAVQALSTTMGKSLEDKDLSRKEICKLADAFNDVSRAFIAKESGASLKGHIKNLNDAMNRVKPKTRIFGKSTEQKIPELDKNATVADITERMKILRIAVSLCFANLQKTNNPDTEFPAAHFQEIASNLIAYQGSTDSITRKPAGFGLSRLDTEEIDYVVTHGASTPGSREFDGNYFPAPATEYNKAYIEEADKYYNVEGKDEFKNRGPFLQVTKNIFNYRVKELEKNSVEVTQKEAKQLLACTTSAIKLLFDRAVEVKGEFYDFGEIFKAYYSELNDKGKSDLTGKLFNTLKRAPELSKQRSKFKKDLEIGGLVMAGGASIVADGVDKEFAAWQRGTIWDMMAGDGNMMTGWSNHQQEFAEIQQDAGMSAIEGAVVGTATTMALRCLLGNDSPGLRRSSQVTAQRVTDDISDDLGRFIEENNLPKAQKMGSAAYKKLLGTRAMQRNAPAIGGAIAGTATGAARFIGRMLADEGGAGEGGVFNPAGAASLFASGGGDFGEIGDFFSTLAGGIGDAAGAIGDFVGGVDWGAVADTIGEVAEALGDL